MVSNSAKSCLAELSKLSLNLMLFTLDMTSYLTDSTNQTYPVEIGINIWIRENTLATLFKTSGPYLQCQSDGRHLIHNMWDFCFMAKAKFPPPPPTHPEKISCITMLSNSHWNSKLLINVFLVIPAYHSVCSLLLLYTYSLKWQNLQVFSFFLWDEKHQEFSRFTQFIIVSWHECLNSQWEHQARQKLSL